MNYYVDYRQEYYDGPIEVVSTNICDKMLLAIAKYHMMQRVKENPPVENITLNITLKE